MFQAEISDNTFLPITFRLSGGWWKNNGFIEIFQIRKCRLQDKFILCVLGYCSSQVIRHKIFRNSAIKRNSMSTAFYKTWELFIWKRGNQSKRILYQ